MPLKSSTTEGASSSAMVEPRDVEQTLASLHSFFDTHAFDTEGPYTDIFAVLLSTCKHLIDTGIAQNKRIDQLENALRTAQQESAVLYEQGAAVSHQLTELQAASRESERRIRRLTDAESERFLESGWDSTRKHNDDKDGVAEAEYHRFVRTVTQRLKNQASAREDLDARAQWLTDQIRRLEEQQHASEKRLWKAIRTSPSISGGGGAGSKGVNSSPPRPLEIISESQEAAAYDRHAILARRVSQLEEGQEALATQLLRVQASREPAPTHHAPSAVDRHDVVMMRDELAQVLGEVDKRVVAVAALHRNGHCHQQHQQSSSRSRSAPGIAVLGTSSHPLPSRGEREREEVLFTPDDFSIPSHLPARQPPSQGSRTPRETALRAGQMSRHGEDSPTWESWAAILRWVRTHVNSSDARRDTTGLHMASPAAIQTARELLLTLQTLSTVVVTTHGRHGGSAGDAPLAKNDSVAALTDRLDTLSGRVEVLEVYAPHTYAMATRPPLLGIELAADPECSGAAEGGNGVRVSRVFDGFLADRVGISPEDVILAVDDMVISTRAELYVAMRERTRAHQVRCQMLMENAFLAQAGEGAGADPRSTAGHGNRTHVANDALLRKLLPIMQVTLTIKRDEQAERVVLAIPNNLCLPLTMEHGSQQ